MEKNKDIILSFILILLTIVSFITLTFLKNKMFALYMSTGGFSILFGLMIFMN